MSNIILKIKSMLSLNFDYKNNDEKGIKITFELIITKLIFNF